MFHRTSVDADSSRSGRTGVLGMLALILALTAPSAVQAQGGQGQDQRQSLMKLREVNQQLSKIRQRAMQDSALQARQQKLTQFVLSEMKTLDDSTAARVERMSALEEQLRAAQKQQDTASARNTMKEMKKLQQALGPAQKKVMKRPAVRKRVKAFRKALQAKMREIDPRADSLQAVFDSLSSQMRGGPGGPGGGR